MSRPAARAVADYDSASVLHASVAAALHRRPFPHLGNPPVAALTMRAAGRLPRPLLRRAYARIGGSEGLRPEVLARVDFDAIAEGFTEPYDQRQYPAVVVGSSNGAVAQLAAAMQAPWLPGTALVPVRRIGEPDRPDQAMEFGARVAPAMLEANPGVALHQMHDPAQDALMVSRVAYFRTKWLQLPAAYERFLTQRLELGAPVLLVDDHLSWPVTRVGERHVFQTGGCSGLTPDEHLSRPHAPAADEQAPEAEWGSEPSFSAAVRAWCAEHGHPCTVIRIEGPQEAAHPVAEVLRAWTRERGGAADRLITPSFVLGDPWRTIATGRVPFWTFFPVQDALASLDHHLSASAPYRVVDVMLFQHGVESPGRMTPRDAVDLVRSHGAIPRLMAVDPRRSPYDIGSLGRYGPVMRHDRDAPIPFLPLDPQVAAAGLARIVGERGRTVVAAPDATGTARAA